MSLPLDIMQHLLQWLDSTDQAKIIYHICKKYYKYLYFTSFTINKTINYRLLRNPKHCNVETVMISFIKEDLGVVFKTLKNIKTLDIISSDVKQDDIMSLTKLTHFNCLGCKNITSVNHMKVLEVLHCTNSGLTQAGIKDVLNLKYINFSYCKNINDISHLTKLKDYKCVGSGYDSINKGESLRTRIMKKKWSK